jgi:hypothetical protein
MHYIGSLVLILWLIGGAVAAGQRHDHTRPPANCARRHHRRDDPRGPAELPGRRPGALLPPSTAAQQVSHCASQAPRIDQAMPDRLGPDLRYATTGMPTPVTSLQPGVACALVSCASVTASVGVSLQGQRRHGDR